MPAPELADIAPGRPRLSYLIKQLEMAERGRLEQLLQVHGISLHQYTTLSLLERRSGLSGAQLARRHFVTPQTMNEVVATLERDGLIRREPDSTNRRILRASPTDRGRAILAACHAAVDELEQRMLAEFSPDEERLFRVALERSLRGLATDG